jgi:hypothetical protein
MSYRGESKTTKRTGSADSLTLSPGSPPSFVSRLVSRPAEEGVNAEILNSPIQRRPLALLALFPGSRSPKADGVRWPIALTELVGSVLVYGYMLPNV